MNTLGKLLTVAGVAVALSVPVAASAFGGHGGGRAGGFHAVAFRSGAGFRGGGQAVELCPVCRGAARCARPLSG